MGGRGRNWDVVVVVVVVVAGQGGLGADGVGVVVVGDWCGCWVRGGADGSRLREDIFGDGTGPAGPSSVRRAGGEAEGAEEKKASSSSSLSEGPRLSSSSSLAEGPRDPSEELSSPSEMEMGDDGAFLLWREIGRGGVALESSEDVGLGSGLERTDERVRCGTEREERRWVAEGRPGKIQPGGCSEGLGLDGGRTEGGPARRNWRQRLR